jgi:enoyl-CoA hydratase/carnithine racemase
MSELLVERPVEHVRLFRLNRPHRLNALSKALLGALGAAFADAAADEATRVVVLTGDERAFSAGADLKEMEESDLPSFAEAGRLAAWKAIERFPKPFVAAVEGYAYGGGLELALLADIVIAGAGARFATPEIKVGMFPGDGGTQRLPRAVGKSRAMQMILTGEPVGAATAAAWGLASEAVAAGGAVPRALEIASQIARHSPLAARMAKEEVLMSFSAPLDESLSLERKMLLFQSEDRREGVRAFVEKRPPHWRGR